MGALPTAPPVPAGRGSVMGHPLSKMNELSAAPATPAFKALVYINYRYGVYKET